jgi:transcriptional regulator with XRE-family HTH domain
VELDGRRLRAARLRKMMTLRDLSAATGVAFDTISRLENGLQRARPSTVKRLAGALGIEPTDLVDWEATEAGKALAA